MVPAHLRPWGQINIFIFTGSTFSLRFPKTRSRRIPFWFRSGFVFACLPQSHNHVSYSFSHLPRCCFSWKTPLFIPPQWLLPRPHMAPTRKWKICFGVKDRCIIACGSSVSYLSRIYPINSANRAYSKGILVSSTSRWMETCHVVHWFLSPSCCSRVYISNTAPPRQ